MNRRWRIFFAVILVLSVGVFVAELFAERFIRQNLKELARSAGASLEYSAFTMDWFRARVSFHDLALTDLQTGKKIVAADYVSLDLRHSRVPTALKPDFLEALEIRNASLQFSDSAGRWSARAEGVQLSAKSKAGSARGQLSFSNLAWSAEGYRGAYSGHGSLHWSGSKFTLEDLELAGKETRLAGDLSISPDRVEASAKGDLLLEPVGPGRPPLEWTHNDFTAVLKGSQLSVSHWSFDGFGGHSEISGAYDTAKDEGRLQGKLRGVSVERLRSVLPVSGLSGAVTGDLRVLFAPGRIELEGSLESPNLEVSGTALENAAANFHYAADVLNFKSLTFGYWGGQVKAQGTLVTDGKRPDSLTLEFSDLRVPRSALAVQSPKSLLGVLSGCGTLQSHLSSGKWDRFTGTITAAPGVPDTLIETGEVTLDATPARWNQLAGRFTVEGMAVSAETAHDSITLHTAFSTIGLLETALGLFGESAPDFMSQVSIQEGGEVTADAEWDGRVRWPEITARLAGRRLEYDATPLDSLSVTLRLDAGELLLNSLSIHSAELDAKFDGRMTLGAPAARAGILDLEAHGFDLARVRPWLPKVPLEGKATGAVHIHATTLPPSVKGHLDIVDAKFRSVDLGEIRLDATVSEEQVKLDAAARWSDSESASVRGTFRLDDRSVDIAVDGRQIGLERLLTRSLIGEKLAGNLNLAGQISGTLNAPLIAANLDLGGVRFDDTPIPDMTGHIRSDGRWLRADLADTEQRFHVHGEASLEVPIPYTATLSASGTFPFALASEKPATLAGDLEWTVAGNLQPFEVASSTGTVKRLEIASGGMALKSLQEIPVAYETGRVSTPAFKLAGEDSELNLTLSLDTVPPYDARVDLLGQHVSLSWVSLLYPQVTPEGGIFVDGRVTRAGGEWSFNGEVDFEDAALEVPGLRQTVRHVTGVVTVDGSRITATNTSFFMNNGWVKVTPVEITLRKDATPSVFIGLSGAGVDIPIASNLVISGNAKVNIFTVSDRWVVSGTLEAQRGYFRGLQTVSAPALPDLPLFLDVTLELNDNFQIQLPGVSALAGGELHLAGSPGHPELHGRLVIVPGGRIELARRPFAIQEGYAEFSGAGLAPRVSVIATTEEDPYVITLDLEGTAPNVRATLTSTPSLTQQDILSLLYSGQKVSELGLETGKLPPMLLSATLSTLLSTQFQKEFLDRVSIAPFTVGTSQRSFLTLGKSVNRSTFLTYSTDIESGSKSFAELSYKFRPNWAVILQKDVENELGTQLKFSGLLGFGRKSERGATPGMRLSKLEVASDVEATVLRTVLARIPLREGKSFSVLDIFESRDIALQVLHDSGFYFAEVKVEERETGPPAPGRNTVSLSISGNGKRTIQIEGLGPADKARLLPQLQDTWINSLSNRNFIVDAVPVALKFLRAKGYLNARVSPRLQQSGGSSAALFQVQTHSIYRFSGLEITGASPPFRAWILSHVNVKKRSPVSLDLWDSYESQILDEYRSAGYLDAKVTLEVRRNDENSTALIHYDVVENRRYSFGDLDWSSTENVPEGVIQQVQTRLAKGPPFSQSALDSARNEIVDRLRSDGFLEAYVAAKKDLADSQVNVTLDVQPGKQYRFSGYRLENPLPPALDRIVRREMTFRPGDPVDMNRVETVRSNLYRTGLYGRVALNLDKTDPQNVVLKVGAERAPSESLSARAGFNGDEGLISSFVYADNDFRSTGHKMTLKGDLSEKRLAGEIGFEQPRLSSALARWSASFLADREKQDAFTQTRFSFGIRAEHEYSEKSKITARLTFERVMFADVKLSGASTLPTEEFLPNFSVSYYRDRRNDLLNPTRGDFLTLSGKISAPLIGSKVAYQKGYAQYLKFLEVRKNVVWASGLRMGLARSNEPGSLLPLSERFFAGGDNSLRGFRVNSLGPRDPVTHEPTGGNAMFVLNQEARLNVTKSYGFTLFWDYGNIFRKVSQLRFGEGRSALGAGVFFKSPLGPFRVEYSRIVNPKPAEDKFRLHFGFAFSF